MVHNDWDYEQFLYAPISHHFMKKGHDKYDLIYSHCHLLWKHMWGANTRWSIDHPYPCRPSY